MSNRIPDDVLAEHWFGFVHELIGRLQNAFRDARANSGLTQKEIGERLGKGPAFISRCLSGQQNMTIRTMHDLARAMGYRLEIGLQPLSSLSRANHQPQANRPAQSVATPTTHTYLNVNMTAAASG